VRRGPAGDERQDLQALRVQPLHVVGEHGDGTFGPGGREQADGGERDQERLRRRAVRKTERGQQRPAVGRPELLPGRTRHRARHRTHHRAQ